MPTLNPTGIDGTPVETPRTIVLTGEQAQIAAAEVRYLVVRPVDSLIHASRTLPA